MREWKDYREELRNALESSSGKELEKTLRGEFGFIDMWPIFFRGAGDDGTKYNHAVRGFDVGSDFESKRVNEFEGSYLFGAEFSHDSGGYFGICFSGRVLAFTPQERIRQQAEYNLHINVHGETAESIARTALAVAEYFEEREVAFCLPRAVPLSFIRGLHRHGPQDSLLAVEKPTEEYIRAMEDFDNQIVVYDPGSGSSEE